MVKHSQTSSGFTSMCKECNRRIRKIKQQYREVTVLEKYCCNCSLTKPAEKFPKAKQMPSGLYSWCKDCVKKKRIQYNTNGRVSKRRKERRSSEPEYREKLLRQSSESRLRNFEAHLYRAARIRAHKKGLEFTINISDIKIPEMCPILLKPLIKGTRSSWDMSPSLDRLDNTKGYIPDNIQVISNKANMIKNCATIGELLLFSNWIRKTFGE